ncbi:unnamed protein product [Cylicocyclus nassatus]|uniref:Cation/H+ exchanger transmembrane domain-containing protein n=1 Tax=Cylicocyclus nassatus TaxID=53992 RepID=A0AA36HDH3_CYLNA|nr:unnamed protein product [Cylicocyclus nassatus]
MDFKYGNAIRQGIRNFFHHPIANLCITAVILISAMYISLGAVVGRPILHPYANSSFLNVRRREDIPKASTMDEIVSSTFSIFFFWIASVIVGKLMTFLRLPSLFGALCVGIFIANIPALNKLIYVNEYWHFIIRKLCLVVIIIRWGLGINGTYIRNNPTYPLALGIFSAIAEALAIAVVSIFFFNSSVAFGIISGFLLATVSPAICGPVMQKCQRLHIGTDLNIPCFVPAACCFDNTFSIIVVSLVSAITFSYEPKFAVFVKNVGEVILCGLIGIFIGWVLWYFPLNNQKHTHTGRILLIIFLSIAIIIGMSNINHGFPGVVAGLLLCFTAPMQWRGDNPKKIEPIANFFASTWFYVASPLLFSLVGTFLKFNSISVWMVCACVILVIVGTLARLASGFAIVACSPLQLREQFVVVWSLVPKATVQAALGPNLMVSAKQYPEYESEAFFTVICCILAILLTAPIGSFLLDLLAPKLLHQAAVRAVSMSQVVPLDLEAQRKKVLPLPSIDENPEKTPIPPKFKRFRAISLQYGIANGRGLFR